MIRANSALALFSSKGAELKEFHCGGRSFMWNANPQFWSKTSPVLFPIVGGLKDNSFIYNAQRFVLPRHGFARDLEFEVVKESKSAISYRLNDSKYTQQLFPFAFELTIHYKIFERGLKCKYEVRNKGKSKMFFSLGAHPAFRIEEGFYLKFPKDDGVARFMLKDGLISSEATLLHFDDHKLYLDHQLFYDDALVFKNLKSDRIEICNKFEERVLLFEYRNFPYFGIWSAKDADFVCLEPWSGLPDVIDSSGKLRHKEGIIVLDSGQVWNAEWKISV